MRPWVFSKWRIICGIKRPSWLRTTPSMRDSRHRRGLTSKYAWRSPNSLNQVDLINWLFFVPPKKFWSHPNSWKMKNHQQTPTAEQRQVSNTAIAILRLVRTHLNRYADVSVSCPQRLPVSKGAGRSSKIIKVQTGCDRFCRERCIYIYISALKSFRSSTICCLS